MTEYMCGSFFKINETNTKISSQYIYVYGREGIDYADQILFLILVYFTQFFSHSEPNKTSKMEPFAKIV